VLKVSDSYTNDSNRNRFILSKGHTALAHYAVLAETGIISREEMMTFEESGSEFPTHETINVEKGIEFSSGSLGYGASLGVGTALMAKRTGKTYHTYVLLGDGECNEGTVWEAVMSASRFKLDNLTLIIDVNNQQMDGFTEEIVPIHDFARVLEGFGCSVVEVDGNDVSQLLEAFSNVTEGRPSIIVAHTVKGKGLPSAEGKKGFHHVRFTEDTYHQYRREMGD
jgi:transketolase